MTCSLKSGFNVTAFLDENKRVSSFIVPRFRGSNSRAFRILSYSFNGQQEQLKQLSTVSSRLEKNSPTNFAIIAQVSSGCVSRAMRWWEKTLKPNMVEIQSAQQLVDYLVNAGDKLVIVNFYSPGCGACKSLHPKICQLAEQNPNVIILKVNSEELKKMCNGLKVHCLPYFRIFKGSEGRIGSFSCTIATIKKLKDVLAKHGTESCSIVAAKGLDDDELLELASLNEIQLNPRRLTLSNETIMGDLAALINNQNLKEDIQLNAFAN